MCTNHVDWMKLLEGAGKKKGKKIKISNFVRGIKYNKSAIDLLDKKLMDIGKKQYEEYLQKIHEIMRKPFVWDRKNYT